VCSCEGNSAPAEKERIVDAHELNTEGRWRLSGILVGIIVSLILSVVGLAMMVLPTVARAADDSLGLSARPFSSCCAYLPQVWPHVQVQHLEPRQSYSETLCKGDEHSCLASLPDDLDMAANEQGVLCEWHEASG